jgi:hypothetical protein
VPGFHFTGGDLRGLIIMVEDAHQGVEHAFPDANGSSTDRQEVIAAFVAALKKLRDEAGRPSFRSMATGVHYSHTALSNALSGARLPSREITMAFVRACGGDEGAWETYWHRANARLTTDAPQVAGVAGPATAGRGSRRLRWGVSAAVALGVLGGVLGGVFLSASPAAPPHSVFLGEADLARYCRTQGFLGASLDGATAYDWHCIRSSKAKASLSVIELCRWQYGSPTAMARYDDFRNPYSWQCWDHVIVLGRPQLEKYCQAHGYLSAVLEGPTIDMWHCVSANGGRAGIDEDSACRWQYRSVLVANPGLVNAPWDKWDCWG